MTSATLTSRPDPRAAPRAAARAAPTSRAALGLLRQAARRAGRGAPRGRAAAALPGRLPRGAAGGCRRARRAGPAGAGAAGAPRDVWHLLARGRAGAGRVGGVLRLVLRHPGRGGGGHRAAGRPRDADDLLRQAEQFVGIVRELVPCADGCDRNGPRHRRSRMSPRARRRTPTMDTGDEPMTGRRAPAHAGPAAEEALRRCRRRRVKAIDACRRGPARPVPHARWPAVTLRRGSSGRRPRCGRTRRAYRSPAARSGGPQHAAEQGGEHRRHLAGAGGVPALDRQAGALGLLDRGAVGQHVAEHQRPEQLPQLGDAELVLGVARAHAVDQHAERLEVGVAPLRARSARRRTPAAPRTRRTSSGRSPAPPGAPRPARCG